MITSIEAMKRAAVEIDRLRARVAMLEGELLLHPNGKCVCAGEGRCNWCRFSAALELLEEVLDCWWTAKRKTNGPDLARRISEALK